MKHLLKIGGALGIVIGVLFGLRAVDAASTNSIPLGGALYSGYLVSGIATTDSSMFLSNGSFTDGTALTGWQCFTVDVPPNQEYICGNASGTTVTNLMRGVNYVNPNTTSSAISYTHYRFAQVQITDYPDLMILNRILQGLDTAPSGTVWSYNPNVPTSSFNNSQQIADKGYVDSVAFAGAPNSNTSTKGIVQEATPAQIASSTGVGSTGADLVIANRNTCLTASTTPCSVVASGTIDPSQLLNGNYTINLSSPSSSFTNATSGLLKTNGTGFTSALQGATGTIPYYTGGTWVATTTFSTSKVFTGVEATTASTTFVDVASATLPSAGLLTDYQINGDGWADAGSVASSTFTIGPPCPVGIVGGGVTGAVAI